MKTSENFNAIYVLDPDSKVLTLKMTRKKHSIGINFKNYIHRVSTRRRLETVVYSAGTVSSSTTSPMYSCGDRMIYASLSMVVN